jgi:hypothetical protein
MIYNVMFVVSCNVMTCSVAFVALLFAIVVDL